MRATLAVVACIAALLLSASSCSGDGPYGTLPPSSPPTSSPPTSSPPTSSPSSPTPPEPTLPTLPALTTQDSPAGAESFARFWLTALDYAYQTGNTKPFRALGACKTCAALADGIEKLFGEGGHYESGRLHVVSASTDKHVGRTSALVSLYYSRETRKIIRGDGTIQIVHGSPRLGFLLTLTRGSGWVVSRAQVIEER
jgi:hypothetical protein